MNNSAVYLVIWLSLLFGGCSGPADTSNDSIESRNEILVSSRSLPFIWENASIYFLLLDRFYDGDSTNNLQFDRQPDGSKLRYFMGGDFKGVTQKIKSGYFESLGVSAIWFTPPVEQIKSHTDEGTGKTYAYHGYWARDWTTLDPNFGTEEEFAEMVRLAHDHGIRIIWDAVLNHTGPVTPVDTQWPDTWVRTEPRCDFQDYEGTVECTLVENLPDIRTESNEPVDLPQFLRDKWEKEGRLEQESAELDAFFERTGYPRVPRYYLIKWLTDWIRQYGIDAFRVDTAKHTEADVWEELKQEAEAALAEWKQQYPAMKPDDLPFFMTGEVYGYSIHNGRYYDYGDQQVDFFDHGFESLINFSFKEDAKNSYEELFTTYASTLDSGALSQYTVVNYLSSHDDGQPFDPQRNHVFEAATKLLLSPGVAQIYYGDETARDLEVEGANGDANLRSFMNWNELEENKRQNGYTIQEVLSHWQKLGRFRREHVAVGAGVQQTLAETPYTFHRRYKDSLYVDDIIVIIGLSDAQETHTIGVGDIFEEGVQLKDYYSGKTSIVTDGRIVIDLGEEIILLGKPAI